MSISVCHPVEESSQVGAVRRAVGELAAIHGFGATDRGRAELVVTELATNAIKHAHEGRIMVRVIDAGARNAIELLAVDRGPGLPPMDVAMRDGYSSSGTAGQGLGAIHRQSDGFDVWSTERGSALRALLAPRAGGAPADGAHPPDARATDRLGAVCCPKPGEQVSGDGWRWRATDDGGGIVMVADGLGHGPLAASAARAALSALDDPESEPIALMNAAHARARGTRGAAVTIVRYGDGEVEHVGVGNVTCRVCTEAGSRQMVSHNGTVGQDARRIQAFRAPLAAGALVVIHSDGVGTQWSLAAYPGLSARHPSLVAAVLARDFGRGRDDATVVVIRP